MLFRKLLILMLALTLTACFHAEEEDDGHDDHSHKLEGTVSSVTPTGFTMDTEDGSQATVVTNESTTGDDLTGLTVGDYVEVDGELDPNTNEVVATKIETDTDPTDSNETLIVVAAGLDKPVVELTVTETQDSDSHVEVEGVVASVAGNAVIIDITEVEHTTADMGVQMTVMLSDSFIKLGALSDIAVGDEVELKGKLDANNNFVIHVMKVEVADDDLIDDEETVETADVDADDIVSEVESDDVDDSLSDADAVVDTSEDDDSKVEYSVEVDATVDSILANILTVTTLMSDDNTVAADMQMIIDIANINIFGADLAGLQADDKVELKGELDEAGNFVVMAIEVESEDDDASDGKPELKGVVTEVTSTAVTIMVSGSEHMMGMMQGATVTISIDGNTMLENGVMPQVGDTVEIDVNVTTDMVQVAAAINIKA